MQLCVKYESRGGVYACWIVQVAGLAYFVYKLVRIYDPSSGDRYETASTSRHHIYLFSVAVH